MVERNSNKAVEFDVLEAWIEMLEQFLEENSTLGFTSR
jgi:hypothetical protein